MIKKKHCRRYSNYPTRLNWWSEIKNRSQNSKVYPERLVKTMRWSNCELQKNEKNGFEKVSTSAWIIKRLVRTWKAFENIGKLSFSWMIKDGIIWSLNQITI